MQAALLSFCVSIVQEPSQRAVPPTVDRSSYLNRYNKVIPHWDAQRPFSQGSLLS